jgi:flagellar biosynthesis/type III secretory pathway protein FliH
VLFRRDADHKAAAELPVRQCLGHRLAGRAQVLHRFAHELLDAALRLIPLSSSQETAWPLVRAPAMRTRPPQAKADAGGSAGDAGRLAPEAAGAGSEPAARAPPAPLGAARDVTMRGGAPRFRIRERLIPGSTMSDGITPPAWATAMEQRLRDSRARMEQRLQGSQAEIEGRLRGSQAELDERLAAATRTGYAELRQEVAETRAAIMGRIDGLQESVERERLERVVDSGTAEMALQRNENIRGDLNTLTDMVLSQSKLVRRMDAELRTLRGEGGV